MDLDKEEKEKILTFFQNAYTFHEGDFLMKRVLIFDKKLVKMKKKWSKVGENGAKWREVSFHVHGRTLSYH